MQLARLLLMACLPAFACVTVKLQGQFGNQLFQIATAYAYALDRNIALKIPDLVDEEQWNVRFNAERLFLGKIDSSPVIGEFTVWKEPQFYYSPIPNASKIKLIGHFQSERYFQHRRAEILALFAAPEGLNEKIVAKYPFLATDTLVVGIQVRDYRTEFPGGYYHPTYGRSYYARAMNQFPKDAIFVVSSNHIGFAHECIDGLRENVVFLEGTDYIEDFYTLVLCKSFIISNSTFGWWAAWLSQSPDKKWIVPRPWFTPPYDDRMTRSLIPSGVLMLGSGFD